MQYNLEALKHLDIKDVVLALGAEETMNHKMVKCFNKNAHKANDRNASMQIKADKNICFCYACGAGGDPINVAKTVFNEDFKTACEWLHNTFNVPYLDGSVNYNAPTYKKPEPKPIEWLYFEKDHFFYNVKINDYLERYDELTLSQKLKMVYTFLYRFSLTTNQNKKLKFYKFRGISEHKLLNSIGFIGKENIEKALILLEKYFPIEDLIKFKLYNNADAKYKPLSWKYGVDVCVVPSFDLYTDMVNGLMLRPIEKRNSGPKEFNVSCLDLVDAYPFAMNYDMFNNNVKEIYFCEGHIDGLSLDKIFVAIPGVHSYKKEWLSLFKKKKCFICFDQDEAGKKGALQLNEALKSAGVQDIVIVNWDNQLGNDLNELLQNGNIKQIFSL